MSKQFANSEKQQTELQAKLRQQEHDYVTAQAQLKQANADLQKLQGRWKNRPP
ncbi:hypothetical protein J4727_09925 [Providencia rettgeri]|uniref:Uncharacterized protein n=1 Tax=Providencia rettgeri TaxID=587 RepID=A0A939SQS2_PRORE|nr:hypothetical protein [Providencia rettgeri]